MPLGTARIFSAGATPLARNVSASLALTAIRRPVVESEEGILVGFDPG